MLESVSDLYKLDLFDLIGNRKDSKRREIVMKEEKEKITYRRPALSYPVLSSPLGTPLTTAPFPSIPFVSRPILCLVPQIALIVLESITSGCARPFTCKPYPYPYSGRRDKGRRGYLGSGPWSIHVE